MYRYLIILIFWIFIIIPEVFSQNSNFIWGNLKIGGGGFVTGIITSKTLPGLIYIRTDVGGAYRLDLSTNTWIPLLDWVSDDKTGYLGVESMAIDPKEPNRIYAVVGTIYFNNGRSAVLISDDYGNTFREIEVTSLFKVHGNGLGRQSGEKLAIDPNNNNIIYYGTRYNGLFKSLDKGNTWIKVNSFPTISTINGNGISFVTIDSYSGLSGEGSKRFFVGVSRRGDNLYFTEDGGNTFSVLTGGPNTQKYMTQRAVLTSDTNLIITYANGAGPHPIEGEPLDSGEVWIFNIKNKTWKNITPKSFSRAFSGISVDPFNPKRIIISSINTWMYQYNGAYGDKVFLSNDGGNTWIDVFSKQFQIIDNGIPWINGHAIHWTGSIEFDPFDTKKVYITSGNGLFLCENIDSSKSMWKFFVKGLEETVPLDLISIPDGDVYTVIGDYDGFRFNDLSKYGYILNPQIGTNTSIAYAYLNPKILARTGKSLYYSVNAGDTWTKCATNIGQNGAIALSSLGNIFLYAPENSSVIYRSNDFGKTWTQVLGIQLNNARPVADPVNNNKFYIYNSDNGYIYVSEDGGINFKRSGYVGLGGSKIIRTVPYFEGHIWVALYNGGLKKSINSGNSFIKINNVTYCAAVGFGKHKKDSNYPTIYIWGIVNGVKGIFMSVDEGNSWIKINDDQHNYGGPGNGQFVVGDMNAYGKVYMSTAGRGVVYGESQDIHECDSSLLIPYFKRNGKLFQSNLIACNIGDTIILSPVSYPLGNWEWQGPQNFVSTEREVVINDIQKKDTGIYTVKYVNVCGATTTLNFHISILNNTSLIKYNSSENTAKIKFDPINKNLEVFQINGSNLDIKIYNNICQEIRSFRINSEHTLIRLNDLPQGIYYVKSVENSIEKTIKILIK